MYQRKQVQTLVSRFAEPVRHLIVVAGPRQAGKTTLVKQSLKLTQPRLEYRYIAVDERSSQSTIKSLSMDDTLIPVDQLLRDSDWLVREWERARIAADKSEGSFVLVLDEIQQIEQWSEIVKGLWDADRAARLDMHVVLLGSSPLLMQKGLRESLAGRFELMRVTHWSYIEMYDAFGLDLSQYLYYGGYPGSMKFIGEPDRWRGFIRDSLVDANVYKDIINMTTIRKPALLKQLFELGCHYSGQIFSYNKMLGQLQDSGNTTTLANYLELLTNAGLLAGLQKFSGHYHLRKASSPKLNVLNTSLMTVGSGYTFEEAKADRTFWGRLVESAVGAHLVNIGTPDTRVYYWRESSREVDFVLEKGNKIVCLEVKSNADGATGLGMESFCEKFRPQKKILVGEQGTPLDQFLCSTPDDWFKAT